MMRNSSIPLVCGLLLCATGCRSISSTFVQRMDDDRLVGNSNGNTGLHENAKPFKGIPVTIPVLTHVDISISEEIFLEKETLNPVPMLGERRNLMAKATPVYSDKIFAVDPKKAASGQSEYTLQMQEGSQYFKKIDQDITDTTIKDINTALSGILPKLLPKTASTPASKLSLENAIDKQTHFYSVKHHVAWKRFDVSAIDFQDQIALFVNQHLNDCNSCGNSGACATTDSSCNFD